MRVTIIKDDNRVLIDGASQTVDCSALPVDFHSLQWADDAGEVEYSPTRCDHCGVRSKKANEFTRDFAPYQPYVDAWHQAKAAADEAAALFAAQAQEVGADATGPQG